VIIHTAFLEKVNRCAALFVMENSRLLVICKGFNKVVQFYTQLLQPVIRYLLIVFKKTNVFQIHVKIFKLLYKNTPELNGKRQKMFVLSQHSFSFLRQFTQFFPLPLRRNFCL